MFILGKGPKIIELKTTKFKNRYTYDKQRGTRRSVLWGNLKNACLNA